MIKKQGSKNIWKKDRKRSIEKKTKNRKTR